MSGLVILPTLNEEGNIEKLLPQLLMNDDIDVLCVDDGSTDNTIEEIKCFLNTKRVFLLQRKSFCGRRSAITAGMLWAVSDNKQWKYFVEMDADCSHSPQDVELLAHMVSDNDVIVGAVVPVVQTVFRSN